MLTTRPLPYNASALAMTTALSEDLNLTVLSVKEDCCDEQMGRKWTIEFGSGDEYVVLCKKTALCHRVRLLCDVARRINAPLLSLITVFTKSW